MMKLVLVSFVVIFTGDCRGFPDGLEARDSANGAQRHTDGSWGHNSDEEDQHFQDEIKSGIYVDEDQYLEKGKAENERESRGYSVKKILRKLVKDLKAVRDNITDALSNQDAKLDSLSSINSNQDSKLDSLRSINSNQDSKLDSLISINSNQDSMLDSLNSAISNQSALLDSIRDCPIGFFRCIPTNQCFKIFTDSLRNWTSADVKCRTEGLTLAQPVDPVSVRSYLLTNYGSEYQWLGLRGDNTSVVWQRGGHTISDKTRSYWYNEINVASNDCVMLLSHAYYETREPNKPYLTHGCANGRQTLCELTME